MSDPARPEDAPVDNAVEEADLAPKPRPGYRSRREPDDMTRKAQLVAAAVRTLVGLAAFGGTLLWFPTTMATPILAGVGCLMMVTGCTSVWKAGGATAARVAVAFAAVGSLVVITLTVVLGAGAFGPDLRPQAPSGPPTVTFEPPPGR